MENCTSWQLFGDAYVPNQAVNRSVVSSLVSYEQSRVFLVIIFLLFREKISEFRINCFKFTQYFAVNFYYYS